MDTADQLLASSGQPCSVCGKTVTKFLTIIRCGHRMCLSCLSRNVVIKNCVDCEEAEEVQFNADSSTKDQTSSFERSSFKADYLNNEVSCPLKCGANVLSRHLLAHVSSECPKRSLTCVYCSKKLAFDEIEEHVKICGETVVTCDYCQLKNLKRRDLKDHATVCEKVPRLCCLSVIGCQFKSCKQDLVNHEKLENHLHHFTEYVKTATLTFQQFQNHIDILRRDNDDLKEQVESCRNENRELRTLVRSLISESKARVDVDGNLSNNESRLYQQLKDDFEQYQMKLNQFERDMENLKECSSRVKDITRVMDLRYKACSGAYHIPEITKGVLLRLEYLNLRRATREDAGAKTFSTPISLRSDGSSLIFRLGFTFGSLDPDKLWILVEPVEQLGKALKFYLEVILKNELGADDCVFEISSEEVYDPKHWFYYPHSVCISCCSIIGGIKDSNVTPFLVNEEMFIHVKLKAKQEVVTCQKIRKSNV